jgi:hypothetical protein
LSYGGNSHKIYDFLFLSRLFSIGNQIHPHPTPPPSRGREKMLFPVKGECRKVGALDKERRKDKNYFSKKIEKRGGCYL